MKKRFRVSVVVLVLYMAVVFLVSSLPNELLRPEKALRITLSGSIKHVVEYAILGVLMANVVARMTDGTLMMVFGSSVFSAFYGVLDEVHQFFVPTRFCTVFDMGVNAVGCVLGVLFYVGLFKRRAYVRTVFEKILFA